MNILAIIPARGGSKGIIDKNIAEIAGKPLIAWTIEEAKKTECLDRIILTSDSEKIIDVAKKYDCEIPFIRPAELAEDNTPSLPVIQHAVSFMEKEKSYKPDYIVLLQPTSPLRTSQHIDDAVKNLINSNADSIVSVTKTPHNCNPFSIMKEQNGLLSNYLEFDELKNMRQAKPIFYSRNGAAIYAFTYDCLMNKNSLYGDNILKYEMKQEESFDIDEPFDMDLCEWILNKRDK